MFKLYMLKLRRSLTQSIALGIVVLFGATASAQTPLPLNDLSAFTNKAGNWKIVGDASVDISQVNVLNTTPGKGVLACIHKQGTYGNDYELLTNFKHGDLDIELDFMMTKGSNSGIYLQGNYEVQLFDSWGKSTAKYNDLGGIYERWNDAMPEGQKGYEGYAPRLNVAKAPGLWQHMKISFQAPRFDASGKKIANAVFLKVEVNGITVHENVEVSGPTRGALTAQDVAMGPLRFQGDHGSLAFRNIVINNFDKKPGALSDLKYKTYYGSYSQDLDPATLKAAETGSAEALTWDVLKEPNNYVLTYTGTYKAPTAGDYTFKLQASGNSYLKVDGKMVLPNEWKTTNDFREGIVKLSAGDHKVELYVNKRDGWLRPVLGLWVAGPGFREVSYHSLGSTLGGSPPDPILVEASSNTVLRSFMDIRPAGKRQRVVHTVSVGSPSNLHYSYDLDKGAVFQVWRGEFLDATPMWNDRGDGSSRPRGSVTLLGDAMLLAKVSGQSPWPSDTTGSGYRPKGYVLDANDVPTFKYEAFGTTVSDKVTVTDNKLFERVVKLEKPVNGLMARLAEGKSIEKVSDGLYAVDGKSYYIQLPSGATSPTLRKVGTQQELLMPVNQGELKYSILF